MTEPDAPSVGSVSVTVSPDARGWAESLRRQTVEPSRAIGDEVGRALGSAMVRRFGLSVDEMQARLARLTTGVHDVDVRINTQGAAAATAQIRALGAAADSSGGSIDGMSSRMRLIAVAAVAAATVAVPALLAIGGAATAGVAALGVGLAGFSGIGAALQAAGKPATGGSGGGGSAGAGISAQQRALSARRATQAAEDRLAQANRNHADAITNLAGAQKDATDAQKALNEARAQAKQDLADLDNKVKDNALAQQQAAIKLSEAKRDLARTLVAPGASQGQYKDQVAQAKLDVQTAQQQLNELRTQGTRLSAQDATGHAQGTEGSAGVVAAKQKLVDANAKVAKAQRDLTVSTHDLAEAQQNIKDTALQNALAAQKAGAAAAGAAGGVNEFAAAMAKLNPIQQQFVEFLLTLKPLWDKLKTAASGFLPGLEQGIKDALPAFQPLLNVVSSVAKAMGGVFDSLGSWLGSSQGKQFLTWLSTVLPQIITGAGGVFVGLFKLVATYGPKFWPLVEQLVALVGQFVSTIGNLLLGLTPVTKPIMDFLAELFQQVGRLVRPVLMPLAKVVGDILEAFIPLLPVLEQLIEAVLPPIISLIGQLVQGPLRDFVTALVQALQPVLPQISQAIVDLTNALTPLIPPFGQLLGALAPLIPIILQLFLYRIRPMIAVVEALTPVIKDLARVVSAVLGPALRGLNALMGLVLRVQKRVLDAVVGAWTNAYNSVKSWIGHIVDHIKDLPNKVAGIASHMFNAGKKLMKGLWDGIKNVAGQAGGLAVDIGKSIANKFIDFINKILPIKVPRIKIGAFGHYVHIGGQTLIGEIHHLATGGLTNGLTTAVLGDNPSGQELVAPMDSPKTVDLLAKAMSKAISGGMVARPELVNGGSVRVPKMGGLMGPSFTPRSKGIGTVNIYGVSDPYAAAHFTANRIAARRS